MADYKALYFHLMHETAAVIERLIQAQQKCEEMFLDSEEDQAADTPQNVKTSQV